MEVTTLYPPAISRTDGDDLFETDVTSVATHSVTLLICLCGLAGNGAVLWLLSLKTCNCGIFDLAVTDFLFLLRVLFPLLFLVEDVSCSSVMPLLYLSFLFQLSLVTYYRVPLWLIPRRCVVYMYKLCWLCDHCNLPLRLRWAVGSVQYWAFFALFAVIPTVTFLCPSDEQELCRAALISMYIIMLLLFTAPRLVSSTVEFINSKWGSQQQQSKRRDIVIVITLLFTLLLSLWNFLQQLGYITLSSEVIFLLTCIHSSIKPFMYFLLGRCWRPCSIKSLRLSLQRVFEGQKKKLHAEMILPWTQGSEPVYSSHHSAE